MKACDVTNNGRHLGFHQELEIWPWLFKGWIALSTGKIIIRWIVQLVSLILIRWIVIYPVDSTIQRLNNRGQVKIAINDNFLCFTCKITFK